MPPAEHASFCSRQRYTLNLTREDMAAAGSSPKRILVNDFPSGSRPMSRHRPTSRASRWGLETASVAEDYPFSGWGLFDRDDFPRLHFVGHRYSSAPTNWFIPNGPAAAAMLRSAGFSIEARPERELFLCRRTARPEPVPPPPM